MWNYNIYNNQCYILFLFIFVLLYASLMHVYKCTNKWKIKFCKVSIKSYTKNYPENNINYPKIHQVDVNSTQTWSFMHIFQLPITDFPMIAFQIFFLAPLQSPSDARSTVFAKQKQRSRFSNIDREIVNNSLNVTLRSSAIHIVLQSQVA